MKICLFGLYVYYAIFLYHFILMAYQNKKLDPDVWGPHYWFFIHTIAMIYPKYPNSVIKKKYYDLIQNFGLFIPIESIGNEFSKMLNLYPVVPYLDSKESLIRWTHFIHNKINEKLEKPTISLEEFYTLYYHQYKPKKVHWTEHMRLRKKIIYVVFIVFLIGLLIYFYTQK
uniref:thiol oxidase n=1 Tax=viral metagenome TaxID=1070528 RepID=A0A6C0E4L9_9ZZZZ